jgi:hypothetical protein
MTYNGFSSLRKDAVLKRWNRCSFAYFTGYEVSSMNARRTLVLIL